MTDKTPSRGGGDGAEASSDPQPPWPEVRRYGRRSDMFRILSDFGGRMPHGGGEGKTEDMKKERSSRPLAAHSSLFSFYCMAAAAFAGETRAELRLQVSVPVQDDRTSFELQRFASQ